MRCIIPRATRLILNHLSPSTLTLNVLHHFRRWLITIDIIRDSRYFSSPSWPSRWLSWWRLPSPGFMPWYWVNVGRRSLLFLRRIWCSLFNLIRLWNTTPFWLLTLWTENRMTFILKFGWFKCEIKSTIGWKTVRWAWLSVSHRMTKLGLLSAKICGKSV